MSTRRTFLVPLGAAILSVLGAAAPTGLLIPSAHAQVARRNDDDETPAPFILTQAAHEDPVLLAHRSHSSHSSHRSHVSGQGGGGGSTGATGGGGGGTAPTPATTFTAAAPRTTTPIPTLHSTAASTVTATPTDTAPTTTPSAAPPTPPKRGCNSSGHDTDGSGFLVAATVAAILAVRKRRDDE